MTVRELAMRLKEMYENSSNEKTTMIHLFGIMYGKPPSRRLIAVKTEKIVI